MAEIRLSAKDREKIAALFEKAREDAVFRGQLAAQPEIVLREYELDHLFAGHPPSVTLDIGVPGLASVETIGGMEFQIKTHFDGRGPHDDTVGPHTDTHPHTDAAPVHTDDAHTDVTSPHIDSTGHTDINHTDFPGLHFDSPGPPI